MNELSCSSKTSASQSIDLKSPNETEDFVMQKIAEKKLEGLIEAINKSLYYSFEFYGFAPRRVDRILSIEVENDELHVTFEDNHGNYWVHYFKGEGWKKDCVLDCLNTKNFFQ